MKNIIKFVKNFLIPKNIIRIFLNFWEKHSNLVFFLFSFLILSLGIYFWYQRLYRSDWSEEKKNQYKSSQHKKIELEENKFKIVVEEIERRKKEYEENIISAKDIFIPYNGVEKKEKSPEPVPNTPVSGENSIAPIIPR